MERWRWMPRDFGSDYIFVNVPAFNVALVGNGRAIARHRVIVGKPSTPTPQFTTQATGVILNPTWTVPQSILGEGIGRMVRTNPKAAKAKGYTGSYANGMQTVVQGPGPGNALGAMKLVMANPYTIYLHDTPGKAMFERKERALSHGCIRTDKALDFVTRMLRDLPGWNRAKIDQVVATNKTTKVDLPRPVNVYISYLTLVVEAGGVVKSYGDIYGRDAGVIAALDR
jgi:murein L,D-transpeptidase YcbB/YkuD